MKSVYSKLVGVSMVLIVAIVPVLNAANTQNSTQTSSCVPDHSLFCKKVSRSRANAAQSMKDRPSGPSGATMRQTVISGGYMSGGHFSSSMGAGATRGHGHR